MALLLVRALVAELGDLFAILVNLLTALLEPARDFLGLKLPLVPLLPCLVPLVLAETQPEFVHGTELGATSSDLASVRPLGPSIIFLFSDKTIFLLPQLLFAQ